MNSVDQKKQEEIAYEWANYSIWKFLYYSIRNALPEFIGHYRWWRAVRKYYRDRPHKYLEFSKSWRGFRLMLGSSYEEEYVQFNFSLGWGSVYITLPIHWKWLAGEAQYGVYYHEAAVVFCWKYIRYFVHMPWEMNWYRTSLLLADEMTWEHEFRGDRKSLWDEPWKSLRWQAVYPYTYTLENGTVQERLATVHVHEREWRRRWLPFTSLFGLVRRTIGIRFNGEVGERTGSYKGGTIGCDYELLPDETPEQCLRRMERERQFN